MVVGGTSGAFAAGGSAQEAYRIVALGDSLAFGYEPGMNEKSVPYGYTDRLNEQALFRGRASLDNYGIIGLRTEGLDRLLLAAAAGTKLAAPDIQDFSMFEPLVTVQAGMIGGRTTELKASLANADLVVITIGANDFGDFVKTAFTKNPSELTVMLNGEFLTLVNNYTLAAEKVLRQVSTLAPGARILISDQYLPLPEFFAKDIYGLLYEKAVAPLTAAVEGLAAKLRAEGLNVGSVPIAAKFKGQEGSLTHMSVQVVGDSSDSKPDIHPTQSGYQAIAEAFAQTVWTEYRKPAPRAKDNPISVVVKGKELLTPNKPVVLNPGVTFLALRDVSDAMGAELLWNDKTKTAIFRQNGREVSITIGAKTMVVNGAKQQLATPAFLRQVGKEKKTYVPLAVIAAGLQYEVTYRKTIQTAFINP
jgi:lysophospholipase L1-like esterase